MQNLNMADTININVTYNKTKRVISYKKDGDVQGFSRLFLQVFSDVLPCKVTPIQVKFLQHDDKMGAEDYQELQNNDKLDDNKRIRAFVWKEEDISPLKQALQAHHSSKVSCSSLLKITEGHISWYPVEENISGGINDYLKVHPVTINTTYRLWSVVSKLNDGIMMRNPSDDYVICNGSFNMAQDDNARMETIDETRQHTFYVAFLFKDTNTKKQFVLTGTGKGDQIKSEEVPLGGSISDESLFEPMYFWSYTMFRNCFYSNYYLGCDHTGKTTLVENWNLSYPNPQALFILNKF